MELANAVWLASVTQATWRHRVAPEDTPQSAAEIPDADPIEWPSVREPSDIPEEDGWWPESGIGDGGAGESQRRLPTELANVARPTAPALPGSLGIVRALRPLKRRVLSWHADATILDEDATAERAAQDGLWLPVTKQDTTPWLDLTLVIDASPSMGLWRSTVTEVISLVQRLGAFRSIQLRTLDTHEPSACRLTCLGFVGRHGGGVFADVVSVGGLVVLGAGWAPWSRS